MALHSPKEIIDLNINGAVNKANLKLSRMIAMGILAGMFIAVGGVTSNTAVHSITNVGLARTLAGQLLSNRTPNDCFGWRRAVYR